MDNKTQKPQLQAVPQSKFNGKPITTVHLQSAVSVFGVGNGLTVLPPRDKSGIKLELLDWAIMVTAPTGEMTIIPLANVKAALLT